VSEWLPKPDFAQKKKPGKATGIPDLLAPENIVANLFQFKKDFSQFFGR